MGGTCLADEQLPAYQGLVAAYIQLRRRPEEEQGNARNMWRILINVLYVNK
jgi:hypothetical protein